MVLFLTDVAHERQELRRREVVSLADRHASYVPLVREARLQVSRALDEARHLAADAEAVAVV